MAQEINKQGKTYRITIEAIGPEMAIFNNGAPAIVETDGFSVFVNDAESIGGIIHMVTPRDIAEAIVKTGSGKDISSAIMAIEIMKKIEEGLQK